MKLGLSASESEGFKVFDAFHWQNLKFLDVFSVLYVYYWFLLVLELYLVGFNLTRYLF